MDHAIGAISSGAHGGLRSSRVSRPFVGVLCAVATILCLASPCEAIQRLGSLDVPDGARTVHVAGDLAYVGAGVGLRIVDVSDPAVPVELGAYGLVRVVGVHVDGPYAFVAMTYGGLRVLDVSQPSAPREIADVPLRNPPSQMEASGRLVWIRDGRNVRAIDLRAAWSPRELGTFTIPGSSAPRNIDVEGSTLYAASYDGLRILDVSDPASAVELGLVPLTAATRVEVEGDLAFVEAQDRIHVLDVSDPADPVELSKEIRVSSDTLDLVRVGDLLFATLDHDLGLKVFDVSVPSAPIELGWFFGGMGEGALSIAGHHAYLAGGGHGFQILDVSLPSRPAVVSRIATPGNARGILVADDAAYVDDSVGLTVVDVRDPLRLALLYHDASQGSQVPLAVRDNLLYVAAGGVLRVMDVSDPADPVEVGHLELRARAAALGDDFAYFVDADRRLQIVDVSAPTSPRVRGSLQLDRPREIAVGNGYLYVADGYVGLQVVDVSDPDAPFAVSQLPPHPFPPTGTSGRWVSVRGDLAYLGADAHDEALVIVDVSDPMAPKRLGALSRRVGGVDRVVAERVYAALSSSGVRLIDVSDPSSPVELAGSGPRVASDLAVTSDGLLVAASDVEVIDFGPEFVKRYEVPVRIVGTFPSGGIWRWLLRHLRRAFVSVTLYGSSAILADEVDATSLALGPDAAKPLARTLRLRDLDGDGLTDVTAVFRIDGETIRTEELCLSAHAVDGSPIRGCATPERRRCGAGYAAAIPLVLGMAFAGTGARRLARRWPGRSA